MIFETLPDWFWIIYYSIFFATLIATVYSLTKKKRKAFTILTLIFTITSPIIGLISSLGRADGMNEFEHFASQLQQGALWSIYCLISYLTIIFWWLLFFKKTK